MAQSKNSKNVSMIVDYIKQNIIFGHLRPRERLIEEDITMQFGVSRHVVRAAMTELDDLGLVTRRPNKGVTVRDFSAREVKEKYDLRVLLQTEAARRIPLPADDTLIAELEAIHRSYCLAHDSGQLQRVYSLNNQFHKAIWAASGNESLTNLIERIWTETIGIRSYGIGDTSLLKIARAEHQEMINLLKQGDREKFIQLTLDHMQPSLEAYKRAQGGRDLQKILVDHPDRFGTS